MFSAIVPTKRRRALLLASSMLAPALCASTARAQQAPSEQLPPVDVSAPVDQNRTRARPASDSLPGPRRPAPGEAPLGLERTGNATFNLLWTYLWMPCVTLPYSRGPKGLPVGIQLVGQQHEDARLLDIAGWVKGALQ